MGLGVLEPTLRLLITVHGPWLNPSLTIAQCHACSVTMDYGHVLSWALEGEEIPNSNAVYCIASVCIASYSAVVYTHTYLILTIDRHTCATTCLHATICTHTSSLLHIYRPHVQLHAYLLTCTCSYIYIAYMYTYMHVYSTCTHMQTCVHIAYSAI